VVLIATVTTRLSVTRIPRYLLLDDLIYAHREMRHECPHSRKSFRKCSAPLRRSSDKVPDVHYYSGKLSDFGLVKNVRMLVVTHSLRTECGQLVVDILSVPLSMFPAKSRELRCKVHCQNDKNDGNT
jgi:hypothetical protein